MAIADLIIKAAMQGGPYAVAVIGWLAWWYERRDHGKTHEKLFALASASVVANVKTERAVEANTRVTERLIDKL